MATMSADTGGAEPEREIGAIAALLDGHWYDALSELIARSLPPAGGPAHLRRAQRLAVAARRVLDLDAEDFGDIAVGFEAPWARRLAESCFPLEPRDPVRGALGSLVPLYELMLEVLQLRSRRREPLQLVVTAHLIGEYLAQLAWETTLGHAGDPLRMAESVDRAVPGRSGRTTAGSRWGTDDRGCPHSSALRATAKRSLNACNGDTAGYTAYLDRFHSRLGDAFAVCAMNHQTIGAGERPDIGETCANPCAFAVRRPLADRRDLDARVRLALIYIDSPIVALRHHAPVGHFFGVPSVQEISDAWRRTWDKVTLQWPDGSNPLSANLARSPQSGDTADPDEALPGMAALVSAVAGRPVRAGHLVREIGADLRQALAGAE